MIRAGDDLSWFDEAEEDEDKTTEGDDTTTTFGLTTFELDDVTMYDGIKTLEGEDDRDVIDVDPILT